MRHLFGTILPFLRLPRSLWPARGWRRAAGVAAVAGCCLAAALALAVLVDWGLLVHRRYLNPEGASHATGPFSEQMRNRFLGVSPGGKAPDFALKDLLGEQAFRLSAFQGHRPVVLIFGSFS